MYVIAGSILISSSMFMFYGIYLLATAKHFLDDQAIRNLFHPMLWWIPTITLIIGLSFIAIDLYIRKQNKKSSEGL